MRRESWYEKYEETHGEIYNPIEQDRLHQLLKQSVEFIQTPSNSKLALDYGCGTGNLTKHLLDLGFYVFSADISDDFLSIIDARYQGSEKCQSLKINGMDLSDIEDNKFDFIGVYSVLHHIPDYLNIIKELVRVTKKGGIIYIDHEVNENFWNKSGLYQEFLLYSKLLNWKTYLKLPRVLLNKVMYSIHSLKNTRYTPEGDIHVWPDDHIEWDKIENILSTECVIILKNDYLVYRQEYLLKIYNQYKNRCNDMRMMVARRL